MIKSISLIIPFVFLSLLFFSCGDDGVDSSNSLNGKILTCDGENISDALLIVIAEDDRTYFEVEGDGNFSISQTSLPTSSFTLRIVEKEQFFYTEIDVNTDNSSDLGDISLCDFSEEYFYFEIDTDSLSLKTFSIDESMSMDKLNGSDYKFQLLPEEIPGPFGSLEYSQEIILDQDIIGKDGEGWSYRPFEILSGDYTFRFSEKGTINNDGIESYVIGRFDGANISGETNGKLSGAFKLNAD